MERFETVGKRARLRDPGATWPDKVFESVAARREAHVAYCEYVMRHPEVADGAPTGSSALPEGRCSGSGESLAAPPPRQQCVTNSGREADGAGPREAIGAATSSSSSSSCYALRALASRS